MSSESSSESEIGPCSSKFDPHKVLYAEKPKLPVENAPMYETVQQFENSLKYENILSVGNHELVQKIEEEKKKKKLEEERLLAEKNKQRFAKYEGLVPTKIRMKKVHNVMTRIEKMKGPLGALKDCVDQRLRVMVITRNASGIRGVLHATLVAFDKQWNLAMTDVLEVWKRKGISKRKIPPSLGTPVPKGTAAAISPVPVVTETPLGGGIWECTRHIPQMMVRGEHVVLVNIVKRFDKPQILAKEHRFIPRMIREAIEIKKFPNFNREDGWNVPPAWDPVLKLIKPKTENIAARPKDVISSFCVGRNVKNSN